MEIVVNKIKKIVMRIAPSCGILVFKVKLKETVLRAEYGSRNVNESRHPDSGRTQRTRVSLRSGYCQFAGGAVAELCEPYSARNTATDL